MLQSSASRPSVKCRITSFVIPEAAAKESRIKLSLWGFTVQPPLDSSFGADLAAFTKAPPGVRVLNSFFCTRINVAVQVFESVVPSECTRLTVGVVDVSIHARAPGYPGAMALHLGEAEFSTELVGNSPESTFGLSISSSHIFLVDSIEDAIESIGTSRSFPGRGVDFWKVSFRPSADASPAECRFRILVMH